MVCWCPGAPIERGVKRSCSAITAMARWPSHNSTWMSARAIAGRRTSAICMVAAAANGRKRVVFTLASCGAWLLGNGLAGRQKQDAGAAGERGSEQIGDRTRAYARNQREGRKQRADHVAYGGHAIDQPGNASGLFGRSGQDRHGDRRKRTQ